MKSIKCFKYFSEKCFGYFLKDYGYTIDDVKGYSISSIKQYHGNVLKTYIVYFKDGEHEYFKVVCFKNFNEYHQSSLGFKGDKLLS